MQGGQCAPSLLTNDAARVLVYVWGGAHMISGAVSWAARILATGAGPMVLRGSGTGSASETVNLTRDYANAFGGGAAALVGIAAVGGQ